MLHRTRAMLTRQRTQIGNAVRAHLAEFGIVAPVGRLGLDRLFAIIADDEDSRVPAAARSCLAMLAEQYRLVLVHLLETDRAIRADSRASECGRRLQEIPGVGPLLASALVATIPDARVFKLRPKPFGLAGSGAAAELVRRQGAARRDHQGRRQLSAPDAVRRRDGGDPSCRAARHAPGMAPGVAEPAQPKGRGRRPGQQDRPHRMGDDGPR